MLNNPNWINPDIELNGWKLVLKNAIDIIETHGWCQGRCKNERGEHCILGALQDSYIESVGQWYEEGGFNTLASEFEEVVKRMTAVIAPVSGASENMTKITKWNDRVAVSKEEVIAKMHAAIDAG